MPEEAIFTYNQGESPLLVSMPHVGILVPEAIRNQMTVEAKWLPDTDWDVHQLYDFLGDMNVSTIKANYSRYVIDLNRSASGGSLYPGQNVTEMCPTTLFNEQPVYQSGLEPSEAEIARRVEQFWAPYHQKIEQELDRIRDRFGYAFLLDAHSIKSHVPRFFDGKLPDFNWGTADDSTCSRLLSNKLLNITALNSTYTTVLNGRFIGGHITRHYGRPDNNIQAIQLELSQATYMSDEDSFQLDPQQVELVKCKLKELVGVILGHFGWR